jgi:hypothetical protein
VKVLALSLLGLALCQAVEAQSIPVTRFPQNPLVTVDSSPTLGVNVNGPTVIRVPDWVERPLGRYYMYFGNHRGDFIRLAYADAVTGPWKVYEPGVLHARDTAFYRPQPDPQPEVMLPGGYSTHLASPEILIDNSRKRIVMWSHGWYSNGERWPVGLAEARAWSTQKGYGQFTQAAESTDGLHFTSRPALTKDSYLRVFPYGGYWYGFMRLGQMGRAKDPLDSFDLGGNPIRDSPYAPRGAGAARPAAADLLHCDRRRSRARHVYDHGSDEGLVGVAGGAGRRSDAAADPLRVCQRAGGAVAGGRRARAGAADPRPARLSGQRPHVPLLRHLRGAGCGRRGDRAALSRRAVLSARDPAIPRER